MAPWSVKEECRKDHAFCVQLSEFYDENAALRARVAALEGENERLRNQDCPIVGSAHCPVTAAEVPECANCQIGPNGGPAEVNRPDITCTMRLVAERIGVRDPAHGKPFFCSVYYPYGVGGVDKLDKPWLIARIEQDGKRMEAAKALRRAAGEANAELVVSRDVLKAFGLLNLALCAYDAALAALDRGQA